MALVLNPATGQYVDDGQGFLSFGSNNQPATNTFGYTPDTSSITGIDNNLFNSIPGATTASANDSWLSQQDLGDWGAGLQGIGAVAGGISSFLNLNNQKKQANRNYDLSLGNFANQAQTINNQLETQIRTRLGNQGISPNSPGYDQMVAEELAKSSVATTPQQAQQQPPVAVVTAQPAQANPLSLPDNQVAASPQAQRNVNAESTVNRRSRGSL